MKRNSYFWLLLVFIVVIMLGSLILPWVLFFGETYDISLILKEFANVNITIAIGLIAATISIDNSSQKDNMIYLGLAQIAVGVISYFLGILSHDVISTLYLSLNGVLIGSSLAKFLRHYEKV